MHKAEYSIILLRVKIEHRLKIAIVNGTFELDHTYEHVTYYQQYFLQIKNMFYYK
jgi:hypothetical protein